jgi:hypothetical protein
MKHLLPLAAGLAALAAAPLDDLALTHRPAVGASFDTRVHATFEQDGGKLTVWMDEQEVPGQFLPKVLVVREDNVDLALAETILAAGDAGPRRWLRRYDRVDWSSAGTVSIVSPGSEEELPWAAEFPTELEGRTLRFESADGADFTREVADDGGEIHGLDALDARLGTARLLPDDEVVAGDSWTVDGEELALLFAPGGDLGFELHPEAADYLTPEYASTSFAGELTLVLDEIDAGEAGAHARCTIEGELVLTTEHAGDLERVPVTDGTATVTTTTRWAVEGELSWSLADARLERLALGGDCTTSERTVRDPGQGGPSYEHAHVVPGRRAIEIECTPREEALEAR